MKVVKLKDICTKGSSSLKQKYVQGKTGKYPVFGASGLIGYIDSYHQEKEYIGIVKDGSGIGRVMFLPPKSSVIGTLQYILPKPGYDINYIGYCLKSLDLASHKQGAAIPHIYFRDYGEKSVNVEESLDEQRKIVEKLNAAFERIDRMQINAETALEEAKGALAQIIRNSFIPAKDWEEKSIGDLSKDIRYGTSKPSCENGKYLYLRMNNITSDGHLTLKDTKTISLEGAEYEKAVVRKGDILFNRTNSLEHVGKTCVFDQEEEMIIAGYLIRVRLKEEIIPEFLSYFLNCDTTKTTLRKLAIGAVHQANISASSLKKVRIKFPENKAEQERIVTQIKKIEDKIKALKCNLDTITEKCNALKQALLKETFE